MIFGPTDPGMFDFGDDSTLIFKGEKCSPCSLHGNRECPKGHHNCMNSINADMVFNEIEKYMNGNIK